MIDKRTGLTLTIYGSAETQFASRYRKSKISIWKAIASTLQETKDVMFVYVWHFGIFNPLDPKLQYDIAKINIVVGLSSSVDQLALLDEVVLAHFRLGRCSTGVITDLYCANAIISTSELKWNISLSWGPERDFRFQLLWRVFWSWSNQKPGLNSFTLGFTSSRDPAVIQDDSPNDVLYDVLSQV